MTEEIKCPKCGNVIGREYIVDDIAFLECGAVLARRLDANCKQCGAEIHWVVNDVRLEKLIAKILARRRNTEQSPH